MTFSILGFCETSGMIGVAIASSSVCVGSHCPWVRSGVGAVTVQYMADPDIATEVLDRLESGLGAASAVDEVMAGRPNAEFRQVAAIDREGTTAQFTGGRVEEISASIEGPNCVASGNVLGAAEVPKAMIDSFDSGPHGHLAERLMSALRAGVDAGSEDGPIHSAALLVVHEQSWPLVNLRIDWSDACPVASLGDLWSRYEPEMNAYVTWAIDPKGQPATE